MAFNGSGTFVRLYSWLTDRNNGVKIQATRMDDEMDGFATGLSNCITKDGQTTITANIPFNNKRLTGLGAATAGSDALNRDTGDGRYVQLGGGSTGGAMTGQFNYAKGADIASASTTNIATATGNYVNVTGTTTITALGTVQAGAIRHVRFTGALTITHNATSLILPGGRNILTVAGDIATFVSEGSGNWRLLDYYRPVGEYRLKGETLLTSGTGASFTPAAGVRALEVEVWGAGGAGGNVDGNAASVGIAGCGAGGGYSKKFYVIASGETFTYTVGAGGAASGSVAGTGGTGGTTTFTGSSGGAISATGGTGGEGDVASSGDGAASRGTAGTGSGGDLNLTGSSGLSARVVGGSAASFSLAGAAPFIGGGSSNTTTGAGAAGANYGEGGTGAVNGTDATNYSGGAGGGGLIRIKEYY